MGARPPLARHLGALHVCRRRIGANDAARPPRVCKSTAAAAASGAAQPAAARAQVTLSGHRGAVTALRYNRGGALLASGAQDTDAIVWDVVAEAGLFRLRAHSGQVTDLVLPRPGPCACTALIGPHVPFARGRQCMHAPYLAANWEGSIGRQERRGLASVLRTRLRCGALGRRWGVREHGAEAAAGRRSWSARTCC